MGAKLHKELLKAGGAESMAAVDEDSWDAIMDIVGQTAQLALIFVEKFLHELLNVGWGRCGCLFSLFEEVSCWVN